MATPFGLLVEAFNYSNAAEDEFNDWYDIEHVPQCLGARGFINAQRWISIDDPKVAVAIYDLESLAVLQSPDYLGISGVNLSPWSKRMSAKCQPICRFEADQINPGHRAAPADAGGLVLTSMNVKPELEAEFNSWYDEEHIPGLSAAAGTLCSRRFKMASGLQRYMALHHLESPDVPTSTGWKTEADTPWTKKLRPHIGDRLRFVLRPYERNA